MRKLLLAALAIVSIGLGYAVATNYTVTQGSGTTFGSLVVAGVNYAQQFICDATTPSQCGAVDASGRQSVIATQTGTWNITNVSGTVSLPTGAATSANQTNGSQTTQLVGGGTALVKAGNTAGTTDAALVVADPNVLAAVQAPIPACSGSPCTTIIGLTSNDPCTTGTKVNTPISQAGTQRLFLAASSKKNYICSMFLIAADAENLSLVEGTGSLCGSSTAAIIGGTTAANGPNLAANGGWTYGNGSTYVAAGANNNFDVCLFQSGSGRVAGNMTYVQQ